MDAMFILPLTLFLLIVAPIWIIAHYVTSWRTSRGLSDDDQKVLRDLWELAPKLEARLANLERILDQEAPDWRTRQ